MSSLSAWFLSADDVGWALQDEEIVKMRLCAALYAGWVLASPAVALGEEGVLRPFLNDICVPSTLWMLSDSQNAIFVKPLIKRWRPYDDYVRFEIDNGQGKFFRRLSTVASVDRPRDGMVLQVSLVNGDEFKVLKRIESRVRVGERGVGDKDVFAQIVGDSFTYGCFFKDALLASGAVPRLHLVGLRKCAEGQYCEGRGGWSLNSYFQVSKTDHDPYHGFLHPKEGRYWGSRAFWKMAWRCVRGTQPPGFRPKYSCDRYHDYVGRFDESSGVLLNPGVGDVQFDNDQGHMVRFDGTAWRVVDENALSWSFDYGKYLAMWKIVPPQFLFVMLGLNDFKSNLSADFSGWEGQIRMFKESYKKACPLGKFVICIPCSTCGSIDNAAGKFTPMHNAAMWRFRDWLIKTFDGREEDGFYLLDTGVAIDDDYGYDLETGPVAVPFAQYKGEERLRVQRNNPHPYPSYPSMGVPIAAFIQYFRGR